MERREDETGNDPQGIIDTTGIDAHYRILSQSLYISFYFNSKIQEAGNGNENDHLRYHVQCIDWAHFSCRAESRTDVNLISFH